jgi:hypothetical protein
MCSLNDIYASQMRPICLLNERCFSYASSKNFRNMKCLILGMRATCICIWQMDPWSIWAPGSGPERAAASPDTAINWAAWGLPRSRRHFRLGGKCHPHFLVGLRWAWPQTPFAEREMSRTRNVQSVPEWNPGVSTSEYHGFHVLRFLSRVGDLKSMRIQVNPSESK